ncbi:helix-turn-helix domain-containing protein [Mesorhizobium sp. M0518]|uniref:helix-turn-helix domain-containing protein n=1 Tax=Mesorhizobium sp. M0518 TaxID=2956956 RepID=UPI003337F6D1
MSEELYNEIGRRIRSIREEKLRATQDDIAKRLGISRPSVANFENGKQQMTVSQLMSFSNVLGVSPIDLLPVTESKIGSERLSRSLPSHLDPKLRAWVDTLQGS